MMNIYIALNFLDKYKHYIVYLCAWSFGSVLRICNYYARICFQETELLSQKKQTFLTRAST